MWSSVCLYGMDICRWEKEGIFSLSCTVCAEPPPSSGAAGEERRVSIWCRPPFPGWKFPLGSVQKLLITTARGKDHSKGEHIKTATSGKGGGELFFGKKKKRTRSSVSVGKSAGKDVCYLFIPCCVHVDVIFIRSLFIMCWLVYCLFEAQMF